MSLRSVQQFWGLLFSFFNPSHYFFSNQIFTCKTQLYFPPIFGTKRKTQYFIETMIIRNIFTQYIIGNRLIIGLLSTRQIDHNSSFTREDFIIIMLWNWFRDQFMYLFGFSCNLGIDSEQTIVNNISFRENLYNKHIGNWKNFINVDQYIVTCNDETRLSINLETTI